MEKSYTLKFQDDNCPLLKLFFFVSILLSSCSKDLSMEVDEIVPPSTTKAYKLPKTISIREYQLTASDTLVFEDGVYSYSERLLSDGSSGIFSVIQKIKDKGTFEMKYRSTVMLVTMRNREIGFTKEYIVTKLWYSDIPDITRDYIEDVKSNSITIISNLDGVIISSSQLINGMQLLFPISGEFIGESYLEYSVSQSSDNRLPERVATKSGAPIFCPVCLRSVELNFNDRCPICNTLIVGDVSIGDVEYDESYYARIINDAISQFRMAIDQGIRKSVCENPNYQEIVRAVVFRLPNDGLLSLAEFSGGFSIYLSPHDCFLFGQTNRSAFEICKTSVTRVCSDLINNSKQIADELHTSHRNEGGSSSGGSSGSSGESGGGSSSGGGGSRKESEQDVVIKQNAPRASEVVDLDSDLTIDQWVEIEKVLKEMIGIDKIIAKIKEVAGLNGITIRIDEKANSSLIRWEMTLNRTSYGDIAEEFFHAYQRANYGPPTLSNGLSREFEAKFYVFMSGYLSGNGQFLTFPAGECSDIFNQWYGIATKQIEKEEPISPMSTEDYTRMMQSYKEKVEPPYNEMGYDPNYGFGFALDLFKK